MTHHSIYRWCAVSNCRNTTIKTPDKLFIKVPNDIEMRSTWLELSGRDAKKLSEKTVLHLCEDHFDLQHDMENYVQFKIMGSVKRIKMRPNTIPSKFMRRADIPPSQLNSAMEWPLTALADTSSTSCDSVLEMADEINRNLPNAEEKTSVNEIIPDLSVVKNEVLNYYDNEFESTPISVQYDNLLEDKKPFLIEETKPTCFNKLCTEYSENENSEKKLLICNKIILGTKPNRVSVDDDNLEKYYQIGDDCRPRDIQRVSIDANYFEELITPYEPNVVLQDVKSYLYKSKRFCATCSILFPEPSACENHVKAIHTKKDAAATSHSNKDKTIHSRHKCTICAKYFVTAQVLRRHMQNIHKCNGTDLSENTKDKTDDPNIDHDETESRNKCFHCKNTFETQKSLIEHLYDILQMKRKKTEIVPVLKTILFKCNKCDIHFTSSQVAADHAEHMEMLINWKCSICNRILKKEDELSHERQHSVSNNFLVYNLEEIDVTKILFRCSKCATHFAESNFLYHFRDCGLEVTKSVHCNICNLLLDYNLKTSHESDNHADPNHFTIIDTDVISDNPVISPGKESQTKSKLNDLPQSFREAKVVLQKIYPEKQVHNKPNVTITSQEILKSVSSEEVIIETPKEKHKPAKKTARTNFTPIRKGKNKRNSKTELTDNSTTDDDNVSQRKTMLKYFYCETCKCFITHFRTNVHRQKLCSKLPRLMCKYCGLSFTANSILTHTKHHEKRKDFKLNNFRFYSLYNGQSINPPIPEYPKCAVCFVHFLSKIALNNHICRGETYQTCQLCNIKLTETAFKVHMALHQYSKNNHNRYEATIASDIENDIMDATNDEHTSFHVDDTLVHDSSSDIYEIIYTCANCSVSVDSYDKVVEHCQGHYNAKTKEIPTQLCQNCNLIIDHTCYTKHHYLHEIGSEFKILKFDSYYFPAENHMWVNHIFKDLPNKKVFDILSKSIYRYECRIKMDVIQQGDSNLTLYKCDQCSCFIEPASLFKHADNSCFKLRQHCCTCCGLPFISSASRIDHEKIHKDPGITTDSFRIVVFNREQDKQFNRSFCLRKTYVLYTCRTCGVIMDKNQRDSHACDITNTKECPDCALRLHIKDYEKHVKTHKELVSFNSSNMKVIVLGTDNTHKARGENNSKLKFKGAIYEYKMFTCNKCEICIKDEKSMPHHTCHYGKQRSKCLKCGLYFSVGSLKTHTRAHERDPDFLRSNMNIVSFDPCNLDQNKTSTLKCTDNFELSDSNTDSDSDIVLASDDARGGDSAGITKVTTENIIVETAKVYKCPCALHFLNEDSIIRHFGVCRSKAKISKQKCPKCDLLFTPNVLFTHLLAHHSNKTRRYRYDIVEMDNTQKSNKLL